MTVNNSPPIILKARTERLRSATLSMAVSAMAATRNPIKSSINVCHLSHAKRTWHRQEVEQQQRHVGLSAPLLTIG